MLNVKPSKIGLLPCFIILALWLLLPPPQLESSPDLEPATKEAAFRALEVSTKDRVLSGRILGHKLQKEKNGIKITKSDVKHSNVLLVTAISPKPCLAPDGDHLTLLSIKNKQDFARVHGFDFYLSTEQSDAKLRGAWNKVAFIKYLLANTTYEWIIWIDYDALIMDYTFKIPFDKYQLQGKELVLWGQEKELFSIGDAHMGLNTGVFYIKNTQWSKDLVDRIAELGEDTGKKYESVMKSELGKYEWALFDQNGFTYVLKTNQPDVNKKKVKLETSYVINGYWKDWSLARIESKEIQLPFVRHFMGCQLCSGINENELNECKREFVDSLKYIQSHNKQFAQ